MTELQNMQISKKYSQVFCNIYVYKKIDIYIYHQDRYIYHQQAERI